MTDSCHTVLEIRKGVAKTPSDASSGEQQPDVINLLDPKGGFALDEWTPKYAGMKPGIWSDTPLTPGRELAAGEDDNVTETLKITLSASDIKSLGVMLSHLIQFRQDARDFATSVEQIEPVYLVHRATGEPGNRYARIVNMEIAPHDEPLEDDTGIIIRDYTLTIEVF